MSNHDHQIVLSVDNVDPDNPAAVMAAINIFGVERIAAVVVTGRPAHPDPTADMRERDEAFTVRVHRNNTARMASLLQKLYRSAAPPVYKGLVAPMTLVPHSKHINEDILDITGANHKPGNSLIAGDFEDFVQLLSSRKGKFDFIVGGPLTEISALMRDPRMANKFGYLTAQLGMFGFGDVTTYGGGTRQFNAYCDQNASVHVLGSYPNKLIMVPTDITKAGEVGYKNPDDLVRMNLQPLLVEVYRRAYPEMMLPRNENIYLHDVAAVIVMAQLLKAHEHCDGVYSWQKVHAQTTPTHVNEKDFGVITALFNPSPRYLVTSQNVERYHEAIVAFLGRGDALRGHYYVWINLEGKPQERHNGYQICVKCGHTHGYLYDHYGSLPSDPSQEVLVDCTHPGPSCNPIYSKPAGWSFWLSQDGTWQPRVEDRDVYWHVCTQFSSANSA